MRYNLRTKECSNDYEMLGEVEAVGGKFAINPESVHFDCQK
jgi:hypothetical protein